MARNKPTTDDLPKYEIIEHNGREARLYDDGTIRNERGQLLKRPDYAPVITTDNAHEFLAKREAKRMRLYAEGAQLSVQNKQLIERYGEDAHLVERAMTLQTIATTADAGKAAVMADTALQRAQGYILDKGDADNPAQGIVQAAAIGAGMASAFERVLRDVLAAQGREAVDGQVTEEKSV